MKRIPIEIGRIFAAVIIVLAVAGCALREAVIDGVYLAVTEAVASAISTSLNAPSSRS